MSKPLMVVFEGPECTGKTTIIQRLADEYSCPVAKRVRTPNRYAMLSTIIHDIDEQLMRTSVGSGEPLILFDRWQMISDIVYEKYCYDRRSILEPLYLSLTEACARANIVVIYMNVTQDVMLNRFMQRGDRLRTPGQAIITRNAYEHFFENPILGGGLEYVTIDTTTLDLEYTYQEVVNIIKHYMGVEK